MKKLAFSLMMLFGLQSFAQVGIANTDPKAQLDISASNIATPANTDGILIPRVNAFPATNPTANQNGMMVFLTTPVGSNQPGFYYWDNGATSWVGVGKNTANAWGLTGNTGTTPGTNFIGTADNQDLIFKRNNLQAGKIANGNTFFGQLAGNLATGNLNTYIGTNAGAANANGSQNVFVGRLAGGNGTTGSDNIFIGNAAGLVNAANNNLFIGSFAGNGNTSGGGNVFIGNGSGQVNSTSGQNTFVGNGAGNLVLPGSGNVLFGTNATMANALTNAGAIGANAFVSTSNSLVLGGVAGVNFATSSVNVGIGTTSPADRLHVVGNIRMVDGNQAAGRVLTSDANGTATWQSASANAWGITGNTGTSAATNFIGTIDNADVVFKRQNLESGRIGTFNTFFGNGSGSVATGTSNTYIGASSGGFNTVGSFNTYMGRLSGTFGASGDANTYLGYAAALSSTGSSNCTIGSFAAQNSSGSLNVFLGAQSGSSNAGGSRNTILGYDADVGSGALTNATAVGNQALVASSNSLVLGSINGVNGATVSTNVGIGTSTPADRLHVVGNIRMVDGNQAAGRVLTSDANGTATWQNASANAWGVNGNAGTSPATNFIGTTDLQDVIFKRNNVLSGRLGTNNTSFGVDALSATTLNDNTAFGFNALHVNTVGNNAAFGSRALQSNTTGGFNTALGTGTLLSNIAGNSNVAIGFDAMVFNTYAGRNIAIGTSALQAQSFANGNVAYDTNNIAIGSAALQANQPTSTANGHSNIAIGSSALEDNTTGFSNIAIGRVALLQNTIGFNNVAIGQAAASLGTTGNRNTALGSLALRFNNADDNVAVGFSSLTSNTIGVENVSVGSFAMSASTLGSNNTALGRGALSNATAASNNVAIGHTALTSSLFNSQSTGIGYLTDVGNNSNSTAIGARAMTTLPNALVLGSIAGVNGATASVDVGIGTTAPQTKLDIVSPNVLPTATVPGILNVMSNDPQGIDVGASITLGGYRDDAASVFRVFGAIDGRKSNATNGSSSGYLAFKTDFGGTLLERLRITDGGDVGIGTTTPGGQFELSLNEGRKPGTNTWTIVSDARLKDVSGDYEKGLSEIAQLRPIRYHYKNVGDRKFEQKVLDEEFPGFLAQEVQTIFPEAVGTDPDGYLNFNMHAILVASVNAIRELNEKNTALKATSEVQEARINRLETELQQQKELLQTLLEKVNK